MSQAQKILIVDDTESNLHVLGKTLSEAGVDIVKARNGNEALVATLEHDFSVAILDVHMPEMDGYELAGFLRGASKTAHLPIIFLTAIFGEEAQVFRGYGAGAVDYIVKPSPCPRRPRNRTGPSHEGGEDIEQSRDRAHRGCTIA